MKSKKSLTEYTDRELLKKFSTAFQEYDSLKDNELDYKEMYGEDCSFDEDYQKLVGKILMKGRELRSICNFVDTLR